MYYLVRKQARQHDLDAMDSSPTVNHDLLHLYMFNFNSVN